MVDGDVLISELDGQVVIQISGDLDLPFRLAHADELKEVVKRHHAREVAIDCSRAEFVDLAGFDLLLELSLTARHGGNVVLRNPPTVMRQLIEYTKTRPVFEVVTV